MQVSGSVLVTGGFGFLGSAVARRFKDSGWRVVGVGRGHWAPEAALARGFDVWLDASVTLSSLMTLRERFQVIVHCAGNGSVGYSVTHPLQDFQKTVQSTADLLEYMRLACADARVIYPSSAGVYGAKDDVPIQEDDPPNPISPYGFHKKIAEDLLASYSRNFGLRIAIIRFFSVYGPGLTKQLLWDAYAKLSRAGTGRAVFWGTGEETRDWIHSSDAAELVRVVAALDEPFLVLNGASGVRCTVRETLTMLKLAMGSRADLVFNSKVREGDPRFYHADIRRARALGWQPAIALARGIEEYASWLRARKESA